MQDSISSVSEPSSSISLREYGDVLRRRRAIILQTFVIVLVAGVLVTLFTAPTYRSTARLLLEAPSYTINSVSTSDPLGDLFRVNNMYSIATQCELLQSPDIRSKVASNLRATTGLPSMTVTPIENTQIIEVASEGDNPELVAAAPNELLKIYKDQSFESSTTSLDDAIKKTGGWRDDAKRTLDDVENKLRAFKQKNSIVDIEKNREEQLKDVGALQSVVHQAETELRVLQVKIASTRQQMATAGQTRQDVLSILADPAIQSIDTELANLEVQRVGMTTGDSGFAKTSDKYLTLMNQRNALQSRKVQLMREFNARNTRKNPEYENFANQLLTYNIDASVTAARAADLARQLAAAKSRLVQFPAWEAEYAKLQRQYDDAKGQWMLFASKYTDLQLRSQTKHPMASIMQTAEVPTVPVRPKKAQNIVFAGLLGLFFGLCLALLQELFDDRINSPEEAERVLRLPNLGHIPMIEEEGLRLIRDISTFSPLMEAYRSLRTNINFAAVGSPMRSVVITSSVPAEGKSTTAANLAMAMALDNKRVIVVDADLRRPSLHKLFRVDSSPGLTDVLVGTHTLDEVIAQTTVPGVSVIPAGSPPPNPAELLGSAAMGHLLATLEASADVVLFDSPPALAVADAVVLASRTNGVLLVVGYGETKKTNTKKAIDILARASANVLGTVLNRMDGPASGYYYGKYYVPATDRASSTDLRNATGGIASASGDAASGNTTAALSDGVERTAEDTDGADSGDNREKDGGR